MSLSIRSRLVSHTYIIFWCHSTNRTSSQNMADSVATLKELQADLNAAFEAVYAAQDAKSLANAKEKLIGLSHTTAGVAAGPALTILNMTAQVSFDISHKLYRSFHTNLRSQYITWP